MKFIYVLIILIFITGCYNEEKVEKPKEIEKKTMSSAIGRDIFIEGIRYKIENVESYEEIGTNEVSQKADGVFYLVHFAVENKELRDGYVFSPIVILVDEYGDLYFPDFKAKFYIDNIIDFEKEIFPGYVQRGVVVFDVPESVSDLKLKIRNDWKTVDKVYVDIPYVRVNRKGKM